GNTKVTLITSRIIFIFTLSILAACLSSNYINLALNRAQQIKMMKELLVRDLKEVYDFSNSQYTIYAYSQAEPGAFQSSMKAIESCALPQLKNHKSIMLGIRIRDLRRASIIFQASKIPRSSFLKDKSAMEQMVMRTRQGIDQDTITFTFNGEKYYGVYKRIPKWDAFMIRAEELNEFYYSSRMIFRDIALIIGLITLISALIGIYFIRHITRFINIITDSIMRMTQNQQLELIQLEGATNDNITFMGMAFNSLSSSINNLLTVFRRFVNKDIASQAYRQKTVLLEGTSKELTVLFSDIKSFTFMTETLGTDIINVLNLHYHRAIKSIFHYNGIIGSIIGDAVLAVFGITIDDDSKAQNKSYQAVQAGYEIQEVTKILRMEMEQRRNEIINHKGTLTAEEERIYQAVLVEVGVGIDGGVVFYGNIGSYERMTNTVIGDSVNAASRLEGLTRIYKVPVICSEYVKNDIERNQPGHGFYFLALDTVQVKGKTVGQKIYWPIPGQMVDDHLQAEMDKFAASLALYYAGRWQEAHRQFEQINLPLAEEFVRRTRSGEAPGNWSGTWNLETK
ncbi:MAG TPA: adenylate/guanylate cyclase domain-containing protein, partial [Firmicutes bacterium]|nr:adenylate/guanylate cyclase domain-containing protein [Bacillota bacterium]